MTAGKFREKITVEQLGGTPDAAGVLTQWVAYCTRRAEVLAAGGREGTRGRQVQAVSDYRVTVRTDATTQGITPTMRVLWRGRTLNIESALFAGREMVLTCKSPG